MSRAETVQQILLLEQVAAEAKKLAQHHRDELALQARRELKETGAAPSWKLPNLARVVLPLTETKIVVTDEAALLAWVQHNHPTEIETTQRVRPAFLAELLKTVNPHSGIAVHSETGEIMPGMLVEKGGQPRTLAITAEKAVKHELAAKVAEMLASAQPALEPAPEPPPVEDVWSTSGDYFALYPPVGGAA